MSSVASAWQAALAAEQQAVFAYSVLGPRLAGADAARAASDQQAHEAARDATDSALQRAGHAPVAPQADYPAAYPSAAGAVAARAVAVRIEEACASAWRYLYLQAASARAGHPLRADALARLTASAVRAARWRQIDDPARPSVPFPGV